jgi:hypothetical protein
MVMGKITIGCRERWLAGYWIIGLFLQDWQCDVYADLRWVITESFASVSLRGCLADAPPWQGPILS